MIRVKLLKNIIPGLVLFCICTHSFAVEIVLQFHDRVAVQEGKQLYLLFKGDSTPAGVVLTDITPYGAIFHQNGQQVQHIQHPAEAYLEAQAGLNQNPQTVEEILTYRQNNPLPSNAYKLEKPIDYSQLPDKEVSKEKETVTTKENAITPANIKGQVEKAQETLSALNSVNKEN